MLVSETPICAFCSTEVHQPEQRLERAGESYHRACWTRQQILSVRNKRSDTGALLCAKCERPIGSRDGTEFRDSYAFHIACVPE